MVLGSEILTSVLYGQGRLKEAKSELLRIISVYGKIGVHVALLEACKEACKEILQELEAEINDQDTW
jgi:hypothetical protein